MVFSFDLAVTLQRETIRMERRDICKSHEPSQEIPFDLVIDILRRLPPKSLMRFKSVSKLWSSLICSKYFSNLFRKVSSPRPRLYMWLGIDNMNVLLSSSSSPDFNVSTMSSLVVDQDLTIPAMEGYSVSQVFHGLMCFTNEQSAKIYNTTTRQLVVLPVIEESSILVENDKSKRTMYCIGHDSVHDQYKVFCTVSKRGERVGNLVTWVSEHWVLLLGGRDVSSRWRNIPSSCLPHRPLTQFNTVNINGCMLYYLARTHLSKCVLVSFDMISEEISVPQLPEDLVFWPRLPIMIDIVEWDGRVAFLDYPVCENEGDAFENECVMKVWVMEDAETNLWSSKTLVIPPSQMNILNMPVVDNLSLMPRGTTREGEVILVPQNIRYSKRTLNISIDPQETTDFYVFLYNIQKNHMRKVEITKSSSRYVTTKWDVIGLDDVENLMYL
ncbi:hypothetical protein BRARA_K01784 [Brassica rapa]|uniref:F-box domain-containing protein n=2 Tax=Brassica campestris TaxID=3711 RepID=A0A397KUK2_BRACM|nr:F-box/kelch-repeat protein At4g19930 [Brassica rapa]RIA04012.1 hypothetical protein BRARA_K01784 [Brassica rapa]CAG7883928.1 unnamed protein product [Brassica rapa]VDC83078.1 unnamed protein product [Brassica rapa]